MNRAPVLIIASSLGDATTDLPDAESNLFARIIRDPAAPGRPPRERACAEMLCTLFMNTISLRQILIGYLADLSGVLLPRAEIRWQFDTELAIGNKRDDLRIEGWLADKRAILWTVEVKVGAGFHESSELPQDDLVDDGGDAISIVNQLLNYDVWLSGQMTTHRNGFVLARSSAIDLPEGLSCGWHVVSWTRLGLVVEEALRNERVPVEAQTLARHFAGYVRMYLWKESEMPGRSITFDDVALLRAFESMGSDTETRIDALVEGLQPLMKALAVGIGAADHQKCLFKGTNRSVLWQSLRRDDAASLVVGIKGGTVATWIETSSGHKLKDRFIHICRDHLDALRKRNAEWQASEGKGGSWNVWLETPLERVSSAADSQGELARLVEEAVLDLKAVGLLSEIQKLSTR